MPIRRRVRTTLALLAGAVAAPAFAAAVTVSNVATFSFQTSATSATQSVSSNAVALTYPDHIPARTPATIALMAVTASGTATPADGTQCRSTSGAFAPAPSPTLRGRTIDPASVSVQDSTSFHAGDPMFIRITDRDLNLDPATRDSIDLRVTSSGGDEEILRMLETGPDTGVFVGYVQTASLATPAAAYDCRLSVGPNTVISVQFVDVLYPSDVLQVTALVDPFGIVFDSTTGEPVNGAVVSLVSAASGQAASVFGDDGVSVYPSTVISGTAVNDASGRSYAISAGGYRFPLLAPGDYLLRITPPAGYTAPSTVPAATLLQLADPDGQPFTIGPGSFGQRFTVPVGAALKVDLPIDPAPSSLILQKLASVATASVGDFVQYQISAQNRSTTSRASRIVVTDRLPPGLRYKSGSLHIAGKAVADPAIAADGRTLTMPIGDVAAGAQTVVTYVVQVIAGAPVGDAVNSASASASGRVASNVASVSLKIRAPLFSDRFTIIGRVLEGACGDGATGVAGARILLDDGTYVVTDRDGQYHFEAVRPGTHVVQLDVEAMKAIGRGGVEPEPCIQNTRFAGSAFSQFVEGQGGSLMRADFHVRRRAAATNAAVPEPTNDATRPRLAIVDDVTAAGGNGHWLEGRTSGIEWLFPAIDHNPRAPAVRVVIKHAPTQTVKLTNAGRPVDALAFDGTDTSADQTYAISIWRGLPLVEGDNRLDAVISAADGTVVERLTRVVHYTNTVASAELVADQSVLVADGIHKPVLAVRLVDRSGHPVRAGLSGPFHVNAPYVPALALELQQSRQLAGLDRNPMQYKVEGDDGIAYIELAPTTETGSVVLDFEFDRGLLASSGRTQQLRAWLASTQRDWVVVGFAKGTVGYDKLSSHIEPIAEGDAAGDRAGFDRSGQVSLYAKGRVLGDWLLTLAYDSAKPPEERQRSSLLGVIDPRQYYTLYGDGSQQRPDAASASKLYLKLERKQFYALFGDFETGLTQTKLARYSRTLNGVKTEYRADGISFVGFAADTAQSYGRDEIAGNGTSGLYRTSQAGLLVNSERIHVETRDRFRSNVIVESRALTRSIDYDIDYDAGTVFFREPIPSTDANFNPVFVIVEYETEGNGVKRISAGGRAAIDLLDGRVTTGVSAIRDASNANTSDLVGVDARVRLPLETELRVEAARSRSAVPVAAYAAEAAGNAHLVELEHNDAKLNALAYLRRQAPGFGINQQNASESGTNKAGFDAQYLIAPQFTLIGQAYRQTNLINDAQRDAAAMQLEYRILPWTLRVGGILANDTASTGTKTDSRQATLGATRSFLDGRLELNAAANVSVGGSDASTDYPSRYVLGASYALTEQWKLIVAEEYARGATIHALTTRIGLQSDPWTGARITSTINQASISEYGPRTFGVLGLKQALPIGDHLAIDFSTDGSRTLRGTGPAASATTGSLVAPGSIGSTSASSLTSYSSTAANPADGSGTAATIAALAENFTAVSAGATWREALWTLTSRIENRNGQLAQRRGLTMGFLRQAEAGIAIAASAQVFEVAQADGVRGSIARAALSGAYRPLGGRWSLLDQLEWKRDQLTNSSGSYDGALFGATSLASSSDAHSTRLVNNLTVNGVGKAWTVRDREGNLFELQQRNQWALYYGSKYVLDRFDATDYKGYTDLIGAEARLDVTRTIDVGFRVNRLHAWSSHTTTYSAGPSIGFSPMPDAWISVGFNVRGFRDRDFGANDYTARGPYVTMRLKFDQLTARNVLAGLGATP